MVTFISQCQKKAHGRTRRVLDTFANRIGDNAWQTVITQEGLQAVKKLLSKTATKQATIPLKSSPSVDPLLLLTNHIAGYQYYQGQYIEPKIQINDPVNLRPQPNNQYDNLAIEAYWNNQKLGYIPRKTMA